MYDFLLFIHVLAAVIWVGGGFALNVVGSRLAKASSAETMAAFTRQLGFIGQRIFAPVSGILFIVGVFMTLDRWSFKTPWIAIGVAGYLISAISGAAILGPLSGKTGKLVEERGADDPQVAANIRKLLSLGKIDLVIMTIVIAAMTMKFGS